MPCFHFSIHDSGADAGDSDTYELPSVAEARAVAVQLTSDLLREASSTIYDHDLRVLVTDDDGALLWNLAILAIEGPAATAALRDGR